MRVLTVSFVPGCVTHCLARLYGTEPRLCAIFPFTVEEDDSEELTIIHKVTHIVSQQMYVSGQHQIYRACSQTSVPSLLLFQLLFCFSWVLFVCSFLFLETRPL